MADFSDQVEGLKQSVGNLFLNSPGPAIVRGTAAVGQATQDLVQKARNALSRPKSPTAKGDIVLPPEKRKGRSLTGRR